MEYRICKRCVMDTSAKEISFDEKGYCNFCTTAIQRHSFLSTKSAEEKKKEFSIIVEKIKKAGVGKKYDCVIGLSGGVDSSYLAYIIVKAGLRPLALHLDNGWNTELAVNNIHNIVKTLNIDLFTHVIDWNEFKELQKAFIKSSVIDLELLSDHAITALFFKTAQKFKIKYCLFGVNSSGESILPDSWTHGKMDALNIKDIYKKNGSGLKIKTYPFINLYDYTLHAFGLQRLLFAGLLDLIEYRKESALSILENEVSYMRYPYKHYESKITHFYQAFILPNKFGIDKRRAHLSSLICSNQLTREEAIKELDKPLYDEKTLNEDISYFIKKLDITEKEFWNYINSPEQSHYNYKTYRMLFKKMKFWK